MTSNRSRASKSSSTSTDDRAALPPSWTKESILHDYRIALQSRYADDKEGKWQREGRAKFCILGAGQEIAQVCAVGPLQPGDWMRGYYRGLAEALHSKTTTLRETFAQVLGSTEKGDDPASGGRMMGRHFGNRQLDENGDLTDLTARINRGSDVSSLASQMGPALGLALASNVFANNPDICARHPELSKAGQEVVHVSIGDSSMAEGIALESIFQAVVQRVPMIISIYDNGYGISVPTTSQTPHGNISRGLSGLADAPDGTLVLGPVHDWDYEGCRRTYEQAYEHARTKRVPVIVHAIVTQPRGHSSSGDHRRYKTSERLQHEVDKDGIVALRKWMIDAGIATAAEIEQVETETQAFVEQESVDAWANYYQPLIDIANEALTLVDAIAPDKDGLGTNVANAIAMMRDCARIDIKQKFLSRSLIAETLRTVLMKTSGASDERSRLIALRDELIQDSKDRFGSNIFASGSKDPSNAPHVLPKSGNSGFDTGAHIIAAGVATLMAQDPRVVTFGEDTGDLGGVTTCSIGLQRGTDQVEPNIWNRSDALKRYVPETGFGKSRVWDTAIAEGSIVGTAAGLAQRGLRPIAEIQYHDYANYGVQQFIEELGCLRHRTDGGQESPAIVWCQGHRLLGMWHAGSPMGLFLTIPGLRIVVPRDAIQAVSMYRALITHGRDPAFVVVPLLDLYNKTPVPDNLDEVCVPLGHSEVLRPGEDVTIITYGYCCTLAKAAAEEMQEHFGLNVEVVDLQTLNPLDVNGVAQESIERIGRVLFLDEDYANGAISMIAKTFLQDRVADDGNQLIYYIESVRTLTSPEHKPCYGEDGGFFSKPQVYDIVESAVGLWNDSLPTGRSPIDLPWTGKDD